MFVVVYRNGERRMFDASEAGETRTHVVLRRRDPGSDAQVVRVPLGEVAWWGWQRPEPDGG